MKIIIDIPKEEYQSLIEEYANQTCGVGDEYYQVIIANGKPLPKGHVILIDVNQEDDPK